MKITLIFLFFFHFSTFSQIDSTNFDIFPSEPEPSYPGGVFEMRKFIQANLEYPPLERCSLGQFPQTIFVQFTVCEDGSLDHIMCIRCTESVLDQLAIDVVKKMPNWTPAEENGKSIEMRCRLPIKFELP